MIWDFKKQFNSFYLDFTSQWSNIRWNEQILVRNRLSMDYKRKRVYNMGITVRIRTQTYSNSSFLLDSDFSIQETPKMGFQMSPLFMIFLSTNKSICSWTGTFWKTGFPDNRIALWKSKWSYSSEWWSRRRTQIASRRTRLFFLFLVYLGLVWMTLFWN